MSARQKAEGRRQKEGRRTSAFCMLHSAFIVFLLAFAPDLIACPVCFGDPNSAMQKGANNGVWVLLGVIAFVQIGFVALFWSFWRRTKELRRRREQLRLIEGGAR